MKPIIKFQIGEEYGLYEFELEFRYSCINQQGYEYMVYKYLGNDVIDVLGCEIKQPILLAYNADILSHIIIYFAGTDNQQLKQIITHKLHHISIKLEKNGCGWLLKKINLNCVIIHDIKHQV